MTKTTPPKNGIVKHIRPPVPRLGDKVRVKDPSSFYFGHIGVLTAKDPESNQYCVELEGVPKSDHFHWVYLDEFEIIPPDYKSRRTAKNVHSLRARKLQKRKSRRKG